MEGVVAQLVRTTVMLVTKLCWSHFNVVSDEVIWVRIVVTNINCLQHSSLISMLPIFWRRFLPGQSQTVVWQNHDRYVQRYLVCKPKIFNEDHKIVSNFPKFLLTCNATNIKHQIFILIFFFRKNCKVHFWSDNQAF